MLADFQHVRLCLAGQQHVRGRCHPINGARPWHSCIQVRLEMFETPIAFRSHWHTKANCVCKSRQLLCWFDWDSGQNKGSVIHVANMHPMASRPSTGRLHSSSAGRCWNVQQQSGSVGPATARAQLHIKRWLCRRRSITAFAGDGQRCFGFKADAQRSGVQQHPCFCLLRWRRLLIGRIGGIHLPAFSRPPGCTSERLQAAHQVAVHAESLFSFVLTNTEGQRATSCLSGHGDNTAAASIAVATEHPALLPPMIL